VLESQPNMGEVGAVLQITQPLEALYLAQVVAVGVVRGTLPLLVGLGIITLKVVLVTALIEMVLSQKVSQLLMEHLAHMDVVMVAQDIMVMRLTTPLK
jgi:hypothetical protein|tara:strand:- start:133 stop:426 length:294 start_codon:yes stop_codon:yes gene_type:complete